MKLAAVAIASILIVGTLGGPTVLNWLRLPRINDITTTIQAPPEFVKLNSTPYPVSNGPLQQAAYPDIHSLRLEMDPSDAFAAILKVVREKTDWEIAAVDAQDYRIEAVAITRRLRFRDDVVIEVRPSVAQNGPEKKPDNKPEKKPENKSATTGSEVHMRSRSRLGKSDLGANAARISAFMNRIREANIK